MGKTFGLEIFDCSADAVAVVAVVVGAAAIDFAIANNWVGGRKSFGPASWIKVRHLVNVAVAENGLAVGTAFNGDHEKRLFAWISKNFCADAVDALGFNPCLESVHGFDDETIGEKLGIVVWRKIGNPDDFLEAFNSKAAVGPGLLAEFDAVFGRKHYKVK